MDDQIDKVAETASRAAREVAEPQPRSEGISPNELADLRREMMSKIRMLEDDIAELKIALRRR